jgi:hypothetical protein
MKNYGYQLRSDVMEDLKECDYKPDFQIAEGYIKFSSELLRLSLLAVSGMGSFILLTYKEDSHVKLTHDAKSWLFISIILFFLASGFALAHRFYASNSMSYLIAYLRKKTDDEKTDYMRILKRAKWALIVTDICLAQRSFFSF